MTVSTTCAQERTGDGNDICRDVGGHITSLGLDDGQGSQGTTTVLFAHFGGTLEQTGVEIENLSSFQLAITRISYHLRHQGKLHDLEVDEEVGTFDDMRQPAWTSRRR